MSIKRGDEIKKGILNALRYKRKTMSQMSKELHVAPSTISHHVHDLEVAGLIKPEWERAVTNIYYELVS